MTDWKVGDRVIVRRRGYETGVGTVERRSPTRVHVTYDPGEQMAGTQFLASSGREYGVGGDAHLYPIEAMTDAEVQTWRLRQAAYRTNKARHAASASATLTSPNHFITIAYQGALDAAALLAAYAVSAWGEAPTAGPTLTDPRTTP